MSIWVSALALLGSVTLACVSELFALSQSVGFEGSGVADAVLSSSGVGLSLLDFFSTSLFHFVGVVVAVGSYRATKAFQ